MMKKRIIACLDIADGRVVKGRRFKDLKDMGDPVGLARRYEQQGADELVLLDIAATPQGRKATLELLERAAREVYVPLTIGGGMRSTGDMQAALRAGADKVAFNTITLETPAVVTEAAHRFGRQAVVVAIDARRHGGSWHVMTHGGRKATGVDVVDHARQMEEAGAGELLLTSVDRDGTGGGFDLDLLRRLRREVALPIIASGGAGSPAHIRQGLEIVDAALLAGMLHRGETTIPQVRADLLSHGVAVRPVAQGNALPDAVPARAGVGS